MSSRISSGECVCAVVVVTLLFQTAALLVAWDGVDGVAEMLAFAFLFSAATVAAFWVGLLAARMHRRR
jgi:hypothetical protein